ncbi:hypothetical protein ACFQGT_06335 [Natrialbaceae archaeon GCM10025810]|uniref:hypothetical protein n=1 Tax=Halovalidus salilacus TaxID=3075124 RepID=UPI00360DFC6C
MSIGTPVTAIGFWLGTLLPVCYVPLFVAGIDSAGRLGLVVALLSLHVFALVVGHDYPGARP